MAAKNIVYVPTVGHNQSYWDHADWYGFAPGYAEKFADYIARNKETLRQAIKAGVKIGMGSDAVFVNWGENARDLPTYVECGMTTRAGARDDDHGERHARAERRPARAHRARRLRRHRRAAGRSAGRHLRRR